MTTNPDPSTAAEWFARADTAAGDKNVPIPEVARLYQKALSLDSNLIEAWAELGVCYSMMGDNDMALRVLERGLKVDPRHRRCLLYRGDVLKRKGDHAAALEAYRALVGAYPQDASGWVKVGTMLGVLGRLEEALAAMNQALAVNPRLLDAKTGKAEIEIRLGRIPESGQIPINMRPGEFMRQLHEAAVASVIAESAAAAAAPVSAPSEPTTADGWYERAAALLQTGEREKAIPHLEKALRLAPRHQKSLEAMGSALLTLGRAQDALGWFEKWIGLPLVKEKDLARAWCGKGVCLRQLGQYRPALQCMDKALALHAGNVEIAKERAATLAALRSASGGGQPPAGAQPPSAAATGSGSQVFTMVVGPEEDPVAAIKGRMEQIAALQGPARPHRIGGADPGRFRALSEEAVCLNEAGRYTDALQLLAQAEAIDPEFADLHVAKGLNLRGLKEWEESVAAFRRAVELDPSLKDAWFYMADGLDNLGRLDHALACYDRVVHLAPGDVDAWVDRGHVLNRLGRVLDAVESWKRALAANPRTALAWLNKGSAEAALGQHAEAAASLEQFLAVNPPGQLAEQAARAQALIGECRARLSAPPAGDGAPTIQELFNAARQADRAGRKEEAIEGYRGLLDRDPSCYPAWMNLGICLEEVGRHAEALPCYEKALEVKGMEPMIWGQKGLCLEKLGRLDEGLAAMDRCTSLAPQRAFGWLHKGRMLLQHGRPSEAVAPLERALAVNAGEAVAWRLKADALEALGQLRECLAALERYAALVPGDVRANNRRLALKQRIG